MTRAERTNVGSCCGHVKARARARARAGGTPRGGGGERRRTRRGARARARVGRRRRRRPTARTLGRVELEARRGGAGGRASGRRGGGARGVRTGRERGATAVAFADESDAVTKTDLGVHESHRRCGARSGASYDWRGHDHRHDAHDVDHHHADPPDGFDSCTQLNDGRVVGSMLRIYLPRSQPSHV